MRLFAKEFLDRLLDLRDSGRAPDQNDLVDFAGGQLGVLERLQARGLGAFD